MEKARIRLIATILAVLMVALTVIYVAYAITPKEGATDTIYAVFLYGGKPNEWYYPQELGITKILDYGAGENATFLHVVVPHELDPGWLRVEGAIFKWEVNGKFYQIADVHVTPGESQPPMAMEAIGIAGGWCFIGVLFWISRKGRVKQYYGKCQEQNLRDSRTR